MDAIMIKMYQLSKSFSIHKSFNNSESSAHWRLNESLFKTPIFYIS